MNIGAAVVLICALWSQVSSVEHSASIQISKAVACKADVKASGDFPSMRANMCVAGALWQLPRLLCKWRAVQTTHLEQYGGPYLQTWTKLATTQHQLFTQGTPIPFCMFHFVIAHHLLMSFLHLLNPSLFHYIYYMTIHFCVSPRSRKEREERERRIIFSSHTRWTSHNMNI